MEENRFLAVEITWDVPFGVETGIVGRDETRGGAGFGPEGSRKV